jgi:acid phosphatase (class A)
MKNQFAFLMTVIFISLVSAFSPRAWGQYLGPASINMNAFPAPPADDSLDQKNDMAAVLQYQAKITPEICERAKAESEQKDLSSSFVARGPLTKQEAQVLESIYSDLHTQADLYVSQLKSKWNRPRPFLKNKNVKQMCGESHSTGSYPSGHSTLGYLSALVFAEIIPGKSEALLERGKLIGDDRVYSGVHYPRDVEAGRNLATEIFSALKKNPHFQSRIQELKSQVLALKGK